MVVMINTYILTIKLLRERAKFCSDAPSYPLHLKFTSPSPSKNVLKTLSTLKKKRENISSVGDTVISFEETSSPQATILVSHHYNDEETGLSPQSSDSGVINRPSSTSYCRCPENDEVFAQQETEEMKTEVKKAFPTKSGHQRRDSVVDDQSRTFGSKKSPENIKNDDNKRKDKSRKRSMIKDHGTGFLSDSSDGRKRNKACSSSQEILETPLEICERCGRRKERKRTSMNKRSIEEKDKATNEENGKRVMSMTALTLSSIIKSQEKQQGRCVGPDASSINTSGQRPSSSAFPPITTVVTHFSIVPSTSSLQKRCYTSSLPPSNSFPGDSKYSSLTTFAGKICPSFFYILNRCLFVYLGAGAFLIYFCR